MQMSTMRYRAGYRSLTTAVGAPTIAKIPSGCIYTDMVAYEGTTVIRLPLDVIVSENWL